MKKEIIETLLEAPPVQRKFRNVAKRMSWKAEDGIPDVSNRSALREAMREEGMNPNLLNEQSFINEIKKTSSNSSLLQEEKVKIVDDPGSYQDIPFYVMDGTSFMDKVEEEDIREPENPMKLSNKEDEDEAIVVEKTPGSNEPHEVYMEDDSGQLYLARFTNKGLLQRSFRPQSGGLDWSSQGTKMYEIAACFGIALANVENKSPETFFDVEKNDLEYISRKVTDIFNNDEFDWPSGVSVFTSTLENEGMTVTDVAELATYGQAAYDFVEEETSLNVNNSYFVHGSINKYYSAEEENESLKPSGQKNNTADFIICGKPADEVIKDMQSAGKEGSNKKVDFLDDGTCYFAEKTAESPSSNSEMFYQISHKKSIGKGDAQLGKFLSIFKNQIGLTDDQHDHVVQHLVNEGVFDAVDDIVSSASSAVETVKDSASLLVNKIKGGYEYFKEQFLNAVQSSIDKLRKIHSGVQDMIQAGAERSYQKFMSDAKSVLKDNNKLNEARDPSKTEIQEKIIKAWSEGGDMLSEVVSPYYQRMNTNWGKVSSEVLQDEKLDFFGGNYVDTSKGFSPGGNIERIVETNEDVENAEDVVRRMHSTHQAMSAFNNILFEEGESVRNEVTNQIEKFIGIEKEMLFGKTKLPVWKLGGENWKPLGDGGGYIEEKKESILEYDSYEEVPPLILFRANPQPSTDSAKWATTDYAVVTDIKNGEFRYTKYAARSRGGTLDFTVEGRSTGHSIDEL